MNACRDGAGIVAQESAEGARRRLCLYRRFVAMFRGGKNRPDPDGACAEFRGVPTKAMLKRHLRDAGASEKLYAAYARTSRAATDHPFT